VPPPLFLLSYPLTRKVADFCDTPPTSFIRDSGDKNKNKIVIIITIIWRIEKVFSETVIYNTGGIFFSVDYNLDQMLCFATFSFLALGR